MTSNIARIPLAIAMSSVLALAVGCSNDRTADDQAAMTPANEPAMQTPPPVTTPADTTATGMNNGMDSEQPGTDTWITTKVKSSLLAADGVSGTDVKVETKNSVVWLSGTVGSKAEKDKAVAKAKGIEGVTKVDASKLMVSKAAR